MDAKYINKTINLPKTTATALSTLQRELEQQLGFSPSMSETILYLVARYRETNPPLAEAVVPTVTN